MLMGANTPVDEAHRMLDRYLEAGGTFIDTADTYGDGGSEEMLAPWLARHRDEVVLATKVRFRVSDPGGAGLAADRIGRVRREPTPARHGCDRHLPGARARPGRAARGDARGARRARAGRQGARAGRGELPGWLLAWAVALQDREGWSPFVALQAQFSLVQRSIELDAAAVLPRRQASGVLPWGPLGAGFLTGRGCPPQCGMGRRAAA